MEKLNEYAERFPQGSVVYYIDTINGIQLVCFGLAHEYFHDALYIKLLHKKITVLLTVYLIMSLKHQPKRKNYLKAGRMTQIYLNNFMMVRIMKNFVK